jgi:hypothetical protein
MNCILLDISWISFLASFCLLLFLSFHAQISQPHESYGRAETLYTFNRIVFRLNLVLKHYSKFLKLVNATSQISERIYLFLCRLSTAILLLMGICPLIAITLDFSRDISSSNCYKTQYWEYKSIRHRLVQFTQANNCCERPVTLTKGHSPRRNGGITEDGAWNICFLCQMTHWRSVKLSAILARNHKLQRATGN